MSSAMSWLISGFEAVSLARAQFAFTMSFHIVFPAFSIGLASYLAVLEALWLWTGREVFLNLFNYWLKIFAVAFGMGVVSGIVMSYQFGTNWSVFSRFAGGVIGQTLAMEGMFAFFLESAFLGLFLYGEKRLSTKGHWWSAVAVFLGSWLSGFFIIATDAWMQHPVGYAKSADGSVQATGAAQEAQGRINPWLFPYLGGRHPGAKRSEFGKAGETACHKAGVAGMLGHDFRRTAVRNMVNAGVPERVAMTLTGHKTRAVFESYHIVSPGDLQDVARRLAERTARPRWACFRHRRGGRS